MESCVVKKTSLGDVVRNSIRASGEYDQVSMPSGVDMAEAREAFGPGTPPR